MSVSITFLTHARYINAKNVYSGPWNDDNSNEGFQAMIIFPRKTRIGYGTKLITQKDHRKVGNELKDKD